MSYPYTAGINALFAVLIFLFQVTTVLAQNDLDETVIDETFSSDEPDEIRVKEIVEGRRFDPVMFRLSKGISQYEDIFITPLTWGEDFHGDEMEVIFQFSGKVRLFDMNLYFAYTQKSFQQTFNSSDSSPFRETNYNPELFYRIPPGSGLLNDLGLDAGIEHESNGQTLPLSHSWNRAYITPYYMRSDDLFYLKLWHRFSEDVKNSLLDPSGDDNPDIQDYYGYSEFHYVRLSDHMQRFHMMLRGNHNTGKGAVNLTYDIPSGSKDMYYRLSLWNGYGESLADYNRTITRVGIGVSFFR